MNNAQEQEKNAAAADLPERPRRKTVWKICRILILLIPLFLLFLPRITLKKAGWMWNSVSWGSGAA